MSLAHLRPLTAGEILDGAFVLYRRHFGVLVAAALIPALPVLAYWTAVAAAGAAPEEPPRALAMYDGIVTLLVWGALIGLCSAAATGEPVSLGAAYRRARDCFWRLFGVSFLSGLATLVGLLLLVVPGVAALFLFFLASHATVIEGAGVSESLERSLALSRANWRRVAGTLVVTGSILILPFGLLVTGVGMAADAAPWLVAVSGVLENLLYVLFYPFAAAATTLLYYDCRVRSEAVDLEAAAERLPVLA